MTATDRFDPPPELDLFEPRCPAVVTPGRRFPWCTACGREYPISTIAGRPRTKYV